MTDRDVYEHLQRRYDAPDMTAEIEAAERRQAEAEAEYMQKPLDERKAEYFELCRDFGVPEAEIERKWKRYLETGSTE